MGQRSGPQWVFLLEAEPGSALVLVLVVVLQRTLQGPQPRLQPGLLFLDHHREVTSKRLNEKHWIHLLVIYSKNK